MKEFKILFTGAMGAGKTTAITAISDIPPVNTDVVNTDVNSSKPMTTVGLDFGQLTLDSGDRVRLFGTPGQGRFDFVWKILANNAIGIIILIDNSAPAPLADLRVYLEGFAQELDTIPCTIGVGRMDTHPQPDMDAYIQATADLNRVIPILEVDVRRREDVLLLVDTLLTQLEVELRAN